MNNKKNPLSYLSRAELVLWGVSVLIIALAFVLFDGENYLSMITSLIGVSSLIFLAKGHPVGQVLIIIFSILYGIISFSFSYFGEMITYLGMTLPMAVLSLVSWLRHPYREGSSEVAARELRGRHFIAVSALSAAVTVLFYFILGALDTANLIPSTISVATSFFAASLTYLRSPYYALGYALNDVVLIVLWVMATLADPSYISVTVCFIVFLVNDIYGFISWRRMLARQKRESSSETLGQ